MICDRRGAHADHRHPAGVPGAWRLAGDDLPSPPPAAAQAVAAAADARPGAVGGRARGRPGRAALGAVRRQLARAGVGDAARRGPLPGVGAHDVPAARRPPAGCASGATSSPIPATPSRNCSRSDRTSCGHGTSQAQGPGEVDVLLPVRDPRRVQPLRGRLDGAYRENGQLAKALIEQATEQQQIGRSVLTLHADRGGPMRGKPVAFLLADLGVTKTHSRPYTSTDNPYSEAHFKTLKYRPEFPDRFDDIEQARASAAASSTGTTTPTATPASA